jgi:mono/diheme cytochrome c family protein
MLAAITEAGLEVPKFEGREILDLFAFVRSQGERSNAPRFQSPGDAANGRRVFEDKGCSACHALFTSEPGPAPDLGRVELRGSVTQIAGRMWNHWPEMARMMQRAGMVVPQFETNELLDLFAYVYIARYEGPAGDPARGRGIYEGKGCSLCHGSAGEGGVGPPLRERTEGRTRGQIMQAMWNHAPQMSLQVAGQNLTWAKFDSAQLADLLYFLSEGWGVEDDDAGK